MLPYPPQSLHEFVSKTLKRVAATMCHKLVVESGSGFVVVETKLA
jgi:hypothetical protein